MQDRADDIDVPHPHYLEEPYVPGPEWRADDTPPEPELVFFCAQDRTFYLPSVHGAAIPDDAVAISKDAHQALIEGMSNGMMLRAGKDGLPELASILSDIETARRVALRDVHEWITAALAPYTDGVPPEEVASWPLKAAAAKAHLDGVPQAMIADEAALTGESADALAALILSLNAPYTRVIASLTGLRRTARRAISAAKTPGEVATALETILTSASTLAATLAAGSDPAPEKEL